MTDFFVVLIFLAGACVGYGLRHLVSVHRRNMAARTIVRPEIVLSFGLEGLHYRYFPSEPTQPVSPVLQPHLDDGANVGCLSALGTSRTVPKPS